MYAGSCTLPSTRKRCLRFADSHFDRSAARAAARALAEKRPGCSSLVGPWPPNDRDRPSRSPRRPWSRPTTLAGPTGRASLRCVTAPRGALRWCVRLCAGHTTPLTVDQTTCDLVGMQQAIDRVLSALPAHVRDFLQVRPYLHVTGGFIRDVLIGATPKDIDVVSVGEPEPDAGQLQVAFAGRDTTIITTDKAYTVHWGPNEVNHVAPPLQIIRRSWTDLDAVFDAFDWTVCRAAMHLGADGWVLKVGADFWQDLIDRRLRFCAKPSNDKFGGAAGSMYRLERFLARGQGWCIRASDLAEMTRARLVELNVARSNDIANAWLRAPGQKDASKGSSA